MPSDGVRSVRCDRLKPSSPTYLPVGAAWRHAAGRGRHACQPEPQRTTCASRTRSLPSRYRMQSSGYRQFSFLKLFWTFARTNSANEDDMCRLGSSINDSLDIAMRRKIRRDATCKVQMSRQAPCMNHSYSIKGLGATSYCMYSMISAVKSKAYCHVDKMPDDVVAEQRITYKETNRPVP
eukprot:6198082-Pleurochrysis_carterae.AAC.2